MGLAIVQAIMTSHARIDPTSSRAISGAAFELQFPAA